MPATTVAPTTTVPVSREGEVLWSVERDFDPLSIVLVGDFALVPTGGEIQVLDKFTGEIQSVFQRGRYEPCELGCVEGDPFGGPVYGGLAADGTPVFVERMAETTPQDGINPAGYAQFWAGYDASTGVELWRQPIVEEKVGQIVTVWDGLVVRTLGEYTEDSLAAFDLKSGTEVWRTAPAADAGYTAGRGVGYVLRSSGTGQAQSLETVSLIDGATHQLVDPAPPSCGTWCDAGHYSVLEGVVLVPRRDGFADNSVLAFNADGSPKWALPGASTTWYTCCPMTTELIGSNGILMRVNDQLTSVDPASGAPAPWGIPVQQLKDANFYYGYQADGYLLARAGVDNILIDLATGTQAAVGFDGLIPSDDDLNYRVFDGEVTICGGEAWTAIRSSSIPVFFTSSCAIGTV